MTRALVVLGALAGCGRTRAFEPAKTAGPFTEITLDTAPGISGLAVDPAGVLWTVAERDDEVDRITLDAGTRVTVQRLPLHGVPHHTDVEGIATLSGDRFAFAVEGQHKGTAGVLFAQRTGDAIDVTSAIDLPESVLGVQLSDNHGAEAACSVGDTVLIGIEAVGKDHGRRWAPVVRLEHEAIVQVYRMWLTSDRGKLSSLDCTAAADGSITGWAIERHFGVTRILRFAVPSTGGDDITPTIALDLEPFLQGRLNLESIAELADGRVIVINDNQTDRITGPTSMLIFAPGSLGRSASR